MLFGYLLQSAQHLAGALLAKSGDSDPRVTFAEFIPWSVFCNLSLHTNNLQREFLDIVNVICEIF